MSLWVLQRLSRCSSLPLEQNLPQNVCWKLFNNQKQSGINKRSQFSTYLCDSSEVSSSRLLSGGPACFKSIPTRWQSCRKFSMRGPALARGSQWTTASPDNQKHDAAPDGSTSKERNINSLLDDSVDPTVPPAAAGDRVVLWEEGPYSNQTSYQQSQSKYSYRPNTDPSMTSIMLFPGQGTQFVGMAKDLMELATVREMFEAASEILGYDLAKACLHGPKDFLSRTQVQQPAILVSSLAAVEKLRIDQPSALERCVATAGFSVGEITALTFAGALTFEDAVQLIKVRSEAMQLASEMTPGGMMTAFCAPASRLGLVCETAKEYCQRLGVENAECKVASFLWPSCKVVAGSEEALEFLKEHMAEFNIKRLKRLNVSGAFHTDHMKPAAEALKKALVDTHISVPSIPVHSNIDGRPYRDPSQIRRNLPRQMCRSVKWEQTMHVLYERTQGTAYPRTYECGPGQSLRAILKMNNLKAMATAENVEA